MKALFQICILVKLFGHVDTQVQLKTGLDTFFLRAFAIWPSMFLQNELARISFQSHKSLPHPDSSLKFISTERLLCKLPFIALLCKKIHTCTYIQLIITRRKVKVIVYLQSPMLRVSVNFLDS